MPLIKKEARRITFQTSCTSTQTLQTTQPYNLISSMIAVAGTRFMAHVATAVPDKARVSISILLHQVDKGSSVIT
ncbi:hypothetical protein [Dysgonomonas sp. 521]|uniref:hypothetical protein n=1 Tax=Dysgonomonas sp. 521 TaxID=2302932 RepID=UPI0013CF425B|nr:hypothetical protein [Dysgonomonas sp. 521]